jgi:hypothetical protein
VVTAYDEDAFLILLDSACCLVPSRLSPIRVLEVFQKLGICDLSSAGLLLGSAQLVDTRVNHTLVVILDELGEAVTHDCILKHEELLIPLD